jgi:hypothetical protein
MSSIRREIIRPSYDPIVVTLDKGAHGSIQREGQYGVDYQYIVNNGSGSMYVPKAGKDAIARTNAAPGEAIEICKSQSRSGTLYVATKVNDAQEPEEPELAEEPPPPQVPQVVTRPVNGHANGHAVAAPAPPAPQRGGFARYLCGAIDAMLEARGYAQERGLELDTPSWEDVRAIANTVYIQKCKAEER